MAFTHNRPVHDMTREAAWLTPATLVVPGALCVST